MWIKLTTPQFGDEGREFWLNLKYATSVAFEGNTVSINTGTTGRYSSSVPEEIDQVRAFLQSGA